MSFVPLEHAGDEYLFVVWISRVFSQVFGFLQHFVEARSLELFVSTDQMGRLCSQIPNLALNLLSLGHYALDLSIFLSLANSATGGGLLQVMLMSGLTSEAYAEFLSDKSTEEKPSHIHNLLKFVALRKDRSAIMAAGGRWDEELDGGDPADGDSALIRAAIRFAFWSIEPND